MNYSPSQGEYDAAAGLFTPAPPAASFQSQGIPMAPPPGPPGVDYGPTDAELAASNFAGPPPMPAPHDMQPPSMPLAGPYGAAMSNFQAPPVPPPVPPQGPAFEEPAVRQPTSFVRDVRADAPPQVQPQALTAPSYGGGIGSLTKGRDAARTATLGTYGEEKAAVEAEDRARRTRNVQLAEFHSDQARMQEEEVAISRQEGRQTQEKHAEYLAKTNDMIDDLARQKVDPNRIFHSGNTARDVTFMVGAMLTAGLSAAGAGGNASAGLEGLNRIIDRDIAAQDRDMNNARTAIQARESLYGQMRQTFGDKTTADAAFRAASLEAAKTRLVSLTAESSNPELKAQAERAGVLIQREQDKAKMDFSQQALSLAQQHAAAGAAASRTALKEDREYKLKLAELGNQSQDVATRAHAEANKDSPGAEKKRELDAAAHESNKQYDDMKNDPVLKEIGPSGMFMSRLGPQLAEGASKAHTDLESLNTRLMQGILKAAKDAEGKPNIAMIERYEERFSIKPGDTIVIARAKIRGVQQIVNGLARVEGADAPDPAAQESVGFKADRTFKGVK